MKKLLCIVMAIWLVMAQYGCDADIPEETRSADFSNIAITTSGMNAFEKNEIPFQQAIDHFVQYLEWGKTGSAQRFVDYCHYESPESLELAQRYSDTLFTYEILRVEQLSSQLWEIEFFVTSDRHLNGMYAVNYVGIIDGQYKVMPSQKNIPADLKENVEIEPYEPHGPDIISPDDVLVG